MISLQSDKPNECVDDRDESLQTLSKTCSIMFGKISKKQYEYLQAMTVIQDDMFDSCNGLVKEQVDMLKEYANRGWPSNQQIVMLYSRPKEPVQVQICNIIPNNQRCLLLCNWLC